MNLRVLKTFLAIHQEGAISQAADRVHLSAAAASAQLKALETELGLPLFVRTGCALKPTPAAEQVVAMAREMLATHERMRGLAAQGTPRPLRLGILPSVATALVPRLIEATRGLLPERPLAVIEAGSAPLLKALAAGQLDAAILCEAALPGADGPCVHALRREPLVAIGPAPCEGLPLAAWLKAHPYIALPADSTTGQLVARGLARRGLSAVPALELGSVASISSAVRHGLGVAVVPWPHEQTTHRVPGLAVQRVPELARQLVLAWHGALPHPALPDCWHTVTSEDPGPASSGPGWA